MGPAAPLMEQNKCQCHGQQLSLRVTWPQTNRLHQDVFICKRCLMFFRFLSSRKCSSVLSSCIYDLCYSYHIYMTSPNSLESVGCSSTYSPFITFFKGDKGTSSCVFFQFCSEFIAWCTCPCILSSFPSPLCQRTRSTHSTCTLGSAWEIWNGYSNSSAWLDWDIDETADCPHPGSINSHFWGILRISFHLKDPPLHAPVHVFVSVYMDLLRKWDLPVLCTVCYYV